MGFFKKAFKPFRKAAKKFIPKEVRPFLPYIAAGFGPGIAGKAFGTGLGSALAQRGLIAAATSAATDEQGNPLRAGFLAAAPGAIQGGLGQFGDAYGSTVGSAAGGDFSFLQQAGNMASKLSQNKTLQTLADPRNASGLTNKAIAYGTPASIDQSAKFAEIRQDEIDEYNRNLLEQGVASKVDRRKAIFGIYKNAGYEEDYINTMLDTYGYADGGRIGFAEGLGIFDDENYLEKMSRGYKGAKASMKNFFSKDKDKEDEEEREPVITKNQKGQFVFNFPEKKDKNNLAGHLATAMDGVQKAYGRSFGEMAPTEFKRFAQGGDVMKDEMQDRFDALYKDTVGKRYPEISIDSELDRRARKYMQMGGIESAEAAYSLAEQELTEDIMSEYPNLISSVTGMAKGGEVEIEEQTDDLGIMDLMRDQGVEYGEQVSNAQNDELLEKLFEEFIDLGFSPEDAARKAREAFDNMSQGQGIEGTQVASGYKSDIEEMYEQYVFEMEEQGLQPMDFAAFLRQAQSGMAKGGRVNYAGGGASYNSSGRYSYLIKKYNKGIPLSPSEADELEMLEMTYADQSRNLDMAGGGRVNMKVGGILKAGMKGISKLKTMVVTKLSRMTDDVELRGNTDYADDTGLDFSLDVTAKSKKGKKVLNELADEGLVEKLDDTTFFINNSQRDAIGEMKDLKASGMFEEYDKVFTRFDQGAGDSGLGPYGGYDDVIDTFYKKAEGGIMNRNLLNTGVDKDMRGGGFIPEGTKEKADDVPARLSKNEFVMTADAVRAAGGGSVNQGAKRMYETMHKLEAKV